MADPYVLQPADFIDDAAKLGCEVAAIRAVAQVESAGSGFYSLLPGEAKPFPKILFEGHHFHRLTKGKFDASHPTLSHRQWTKAFYGQDQRARFSQAAALDPAAARLATSWGTFQIMGFNFSVCGYKTVNSFVTAMCRDANSHLEAFTQFVIANGLADELQRKDFATFARVYNGPGYAANQYDTKMMKAYLKYIQQ